MPSLETYGIRGKENYLGDVGEYYDIKRIRTLRKLSIFVTNDIGFHGEKETFREILKCMRFGSKKCKNRRCLLTEGHGTVSRRATNLTTLRNSEKGLRNQAVYSDGTWVHAHYTIKTVDRMTKFRE